MLTIVGLGPGDPGQMSRAAWETIQAARSILVRTRVHPTVPFLESHGIQVASCDDLYDGADTFEQAYERIADRVMSRVEQDGSVVFAVPGHPLFGERTVRLLQERARSVQLPVKIISSPGFVDVVMTAIHLDVSEGLVVLDAVNPAPHPPGLPVIYYQVYDQMVASDLKLTLLEDCPPETRVWHVRAAGTSDEKVQQLPLYELDRVPCDHLTSVVVPALPSPAAPAELDLVETDGESTNFNQLVALMRTLRSPEGCPWDLEQDLGSLRRYVLEEAYEVVDCIDRDDIEHLPEELGDLLLQVVFQSQIASENGWFGVEDVVQSICDKLIRRHPHVFGDVQVEDSGEVIRNWDAINKAERAQTGSTGEAGHPEGALSGVPVGMPAVIRACQVFRKAARVGFDWPDTEGPLDKVAEELLEVREALQSGDEQALSAEVGDLFLAAVNAARKLEVDPETAMREALLRFIRRFEGMETAARQESRTLSEMTLEEMDHLWEKMKARESLS